MASLSLGTAQLKPGLGLTASSLMLTNVWMEGVEPEAKARFLAESISELMNMTVLGLPAGLLIGILLVWRRRLSAGTR